MQKVYPRCAGLDIHKDSVYACVLVDGQKSILKFGTNVRELLRLGENQPVNARRVGPARPITGSKAH